MTAPIAPTVEMIGCCGGCGRKVPDPAAAGWTALEITGRYRCNECGIVLALASTTPGAPPRDEGDPLPPHSRGALKEMPVRPPLREGVRP